MEGWKEGRLFRAGRSVEYGGLEGGLSMESWKER